MCVCVCVCVCVQSVPDHISPDGVFKKSKRAGADAGGKGSSPKSTSGSRGRKKARPYSPRRPSYSANKVEMLKSSGRT